MLTFRCLGQHEGGVGGEPGGRKGERLGWLRREADIGAGAAGKAPDIGLSANLPPSYNWLARDVNKGGVWAEALLYLTSGRCSEPCASARGAMLSSWGETGQGIFVLFSFSLFAMKSNQELGCLGYISSFNLVSMCLSVDTGACMYRGVDT